MALVEFKCPNCGGEISYSANKGKMTCPYCDSEFSIKTVEEYNESLKDEIENDISWTLDTEQFDDDYTLDDLIEYLEEQVVLIK